MQQTTNMNLMVIAHSFMLLQQTLVELATCKARALHALHYSNMYLFPFVFLSVTLWGLYRETVQQQAQFSFIPACLNS